MFIGEEDNEIVRKSVKTVDYFIKNKELIDFYTLKLDDELKKYDLGKPENKPDVQKQVEKVKARLNEQNDIATKNVRTKSKFYLLQMKMEK